MKKARKKNIITWHSYKFEFEGEKQNLFLCMQTIENIRKKVLKSIKECRNRYNRGFSKLLTNPSQFGERYREWNAPTEFCDHAEYRSFNIVGLNTWKKLEWAYNKVFTILEKELLNPKKEKKKEEIVVELNQKRTQNNRNILISVEEE
jgi:hypothetical protein